MRAVQEGRTGGEGTKVSRTQLHHPHALETSALAEQKKLALTRSLGKSRALRQIKDQYLDSVYTSRGLFDLYKLCIKKTLYELEYKVYQA